MENDMKPAILTNQKNMDCNKELVLIIQSLKKDIDYTAVKGR